MEPISILIRTIRTILFHKWVALLWPFICVLKPPPPPSTLHRFPPYSSFRPPSVSICQPLDLHIDYYTILIVPIERTLPDMFLFLSASLWSLLNVMTSDLLCFVFFVVYPSFWRLQHLIPAMEMPVQSTERISTFNLFVLPLNVNLKLSKWDRIKRRKKSFKSIFLTVPYYTHHKYFYCLMWLRLLSALGDGHPTASLLLIMYRRPSGGTRWGGMGGRFGRRLVGMRTGQRGKQRGADVNYLRPARGSHAERQGSDIWKRERSSVFGAAWRRAEVNEILYRCKPPRTNLRNPSALIKGRISALLVSH